MGIWRDPMWRHMLQVQHGDTCSPLIEGPKPGNKIVLLSNAKRGASSIAKQFKYRTDRQHVSAHLLQTSASSNDTSDATPGLHYGLVHLLDIGKADPGFWAVSGAVRAQCTKAKEDYETTMEKAYWTKFKAYDEVPI